MGTRWSRLWSRLRRRGRGSGGEEATSGSGAAKSSVPAALLPPPAGALPSASVDGDVLAAVGAACELQERLQFDFRARDATVTRRDVEPYRLISSGRHWYLLAYDVGRADWRTFRLDRMTPRYPTGPRFQLRQIPTGNDAPFLSAGGDGSSSRAGVPDLTTAGADREGVAASPEPQVVAAIAGWARDMLAPGAAVVLDTETTDLPGAICEIAVVDAATGETLLDTLVDPGAEMSDRAQAIHGISAADLVGAPTWAAVLPRLLHVSAGRQVLAYNVEFDAGVIRADTERYGLTLGPLERSDRWDCVMLRRAQTLPGGSPLALGAGHRARGDALAALDVLRDMAALSPVPSQASAVTAAASTG